MIDRLFLTTAIPFVNGSPHLGHALEYVHTDVFARHARSRGRAVRFLTGTDEHAAKNVLAARAAGEEVAPFVARNAERFRALAGSLGVSYDDFLRTGADPRHRPAVEEIWRRCAANGDLYRGHYVGWYCAGCEEFREPDSETGGRCPEHDAPLERVEEENWFFRLSRYRAALTELIAGGHLRIEPEARRNEVLGFLAGPLHDVSVSRPRARVHDWGIPVPDDPEHVIYVWFDALTNYVSALGFGGPDETLYREWWLGADERTHVVGKGIVRFHALIWPAILFAAGAPQPTTLVVHDYVTASGRKIGKSLGNAVDPSALIDHYGADALRWWLCREVPRLGEVDFTEDRLVESVNRDLANGVGNLVQRTVTLAVRAFGSDKIDRVAESELAARAGAARTSIDVALARFDPRAATEALIGLVDAGNRYVDATRPWELLGEQGDLDAARAVLAPLVGAVRAIAFELEPFVPELASRLRERIGDDGGPVRPGQPVQPRLEVDELTRA